MNRGRKEERRKRGSTYGVRVVCRVNLGGQRQIGRPPMLGLQHGQRGCRPPPRPPWRVVLPSSTSLQPTPPTRERCVGIRGGEEKLAGGPALSVGTFLVAQADPSGTRRVSGRPISVPPGLTRLDILTRLLLCWWGDLQNFFFLLFHY